MVIRVPGGRRGGSSGPTTCPFGEIITYTEEETEKTGIKGGIVYAGDKVWNMPPYEIELETDAVLLVWITTGVTANTDDDSEVILSGIETSDEPAWVSGTIGSGYPAQTIPTDPAVATGTSIVAIGTLTVASGAASFARAGCGNLHLIACPGTLSHTRL